MSGFNNDLPLPVSLSRQQWEHALTMMAKQPFEQVALLIAEIQRQCQMHEMRQRVNQQQQPRLVPEDYAPIEQVAE
jgi:hypothetical protein